MGNTKLEHKEGVRKTQIMWIRGLKVAAIGQLREGREDEGERRGENWMGRGVGRDLPGQASIRVYLRR